MSCNSTTCTCRSPSPVCQNCMRNAEELEAEGYDLIRVHISTGKVADDLDLCGPCAGYLVSGRICGIFDRHVCPPPAERVTSESLNADVAQAILDHANGNTRPYQEVFDEIRGQ